MPWTNLCAGINGANEILNIRVVSIGLIDRSSVHPREVFADALSDRASAVIVAHNHPSGGVEPSQSDINITAQLKAAGEIVGIELLDHIIFKRNRITTVSWKPEGFREKVPYISAGSPKEELHWHMANRGNGTLG